MAGETFVDTSGLYAVMIRKDEAHAHAVRFLKHAARKGGRFVTSDYVLDETVTLLKARGQGHLVKRLLDATLHSNACQVVWTDVAAFDRAAKFILKHDDKNWSFTDCVSFCIMRERHLRKALTKDIHFVEAGFEVLLNAAK